MTESLVKIESQPLALNNAADAFEVDFGTIEKITPFTLSLDQPMSQCDNPQPGMLRINETGLLRKEVKIVLLEKPRKSRRLEIGKFPNAKLLCKSRDMKSPDKDSPSAQAMFCAGCKHASWDRYNANPCEENLPGCRVTSRIIMIDYDRLAPIQSYVRGKSSTELENGLQQVIQQFVALREANGKVSWTDVALTLTSAKQKGNPNYMLIVRDVHPLSPEEKKHLAGIVSIIGLQKAALMRKADEIAENAENDQNQEDRNSAVENAINNASTTTSAPASTPIEGEYVSGEKGSIEEV